MKRYNCKSSSQVRATSIGVSIVLIIILINIILQFNNIGIYASTISLFIIIGVIFYLLSFSVSRIVLTQNHVVIHKFFGKKIIPYTSISNVNRNNNTSITMTTGSQVFFGMFGKTMDGKISYVKDRNKMVSISTQNGDILISCEHPEEFVLELNEQKKDIKL